MLEQFLSERRSQTEELLEHYTQWAPALKGQEELALGLGLFESLHLREDGHRRTSHSIDNLIAEVISP